MITALKNKFKYLAALVVLAIPAIALAQNPLQGGMTGLQSYFGTGGLSGQTSLSNLIVEVVRLLLLFAGGVAIVFVIIGGYYYITSGGNEETAEKGKKTLINAIIGIVVIVLAYAIINVIANLVSNPGGYGLLNTYFFNA